MMLFDADDLNSNFVLKKLHYRYTHFGFIGLVKFLSNAVKLYLLKSLLRKQYYTKKIHDYKMQLLLSDMGIGRELFMNGTREDQLRYLLQEEISEGDTVLDIGANIGYYPLMEASFVGENGFVYAVEPSPENYGNLQKNIALNGKSEIFETYNIGISNKVGKEQFYLSSHSNLHTFMREGCNGGYVTKGTSDEYIEVNVADLSSFLKEKKRIDLIRMDVEGYEVEILEGLEGAISSGLFEGKIVFECHFPKYSESTHSISKRLKFLFDNNYYVKALTSTDETKSKIRDFGYIPDKVIFTGGINQGIYYNVSNEHAIKLLSELGGVRDILLVKASNQD